MPRTGLGQLNPVYLHSMKTNQKDDLVLPNMEEKITIAQVPLAQFKS